MSGTRDHAALGASNASRWMACPGSVNAEEGLPNESTSYAQEGTAAHALAELCLDLKRDAWTWLGETIETVVVTEEMADAVQVYVDYVRGLIGTCTEYGIERQFDLAPLKPPRPMFGTTDFYGFVEGEDGLTLHVADLKFGQGYAVVATDNPQGRYYALGAWVDLATRNYAQARRVRWVTVHIVQPRILDREGKPTISVETLSIVTLRLWAHQLLEAAVRTTTQDPPRHAGDHCRFCKAKPTCSAFRDKALAVAQTSFSLVTARQATVPVPGEMTDEQLAAVLDHKDLLEAFLTAVDKEAMGRLEQGKTIPGWGRKPKRATRKWVSESAAADWAEEAGLVPADYEVTTIKSPAQLEKVVGKNKIPASLLTSVSSGDTLCRASNPQALSPAPTAFPAIAQGSLL